MAEGHISMVGKPTSHLVVNTIMMTLIVAIFGLLLHRRSQPAPGGIRRSELQPVQLELVTVHHDGSLLGGAADAFYYVVRTSFSI